jgi:hypothetical protein
LATDTTDWLLEMTESTDARRAVIADDVVLGACIAAAACH